MCFSADNPISPRFHTTYLMSNRKLPLTGQVANPPTFRPAKGFTCLIMLILFFLPSLDAFIILLRL